MRHTFGCHSAAGHTGADQTVLQVGLNHVQTSLFPNIAVTNKELDVKGQLSA